MQQLRAKSIPANNSDISIFGRGAGGTGCMENCISGVLRGQGSVGNLILQMLELKYDFVKRLQFYYMSLFVII